MACLSVSEPVCVCVCFPPPPPPPPPRRGDKDSNVHELVGGAFGGRQFSDGTTTLTDENGEEHIELGRQEVVRIPEQCPSCSFPGECLTALTDIPHFKEVRCCPVQFICRYILYSVVLA